MKTYRTSILQGLFEGLMLAAAYLLTKSWAVTIATGIVTTLAVNRFWPR